MPQHLAFFLSSIWYTLGTIIVCGLVVAFCRWLFVVMLGDGFGRGVVIGTSILGTPVHELSHALMCLIFGHKIVKMSLWQPADKSGTLGYVSHSYNAGNLYQVFGNLFIGVGPIFGGLGVMTLILWLCFPGALETYMQTAATVVSSGEPDFWQGFTLFFEGFRLFPSMVSEAMTDASVPLWARIIGVVAILSVSLHIDLSPADIRGSLGAIPLYLALMLLLTAVCALIGPGAITAVSSALAMFSAYVTSLFVIVLVMAVAQVILALPVFIIRRIF